MLTVNGIVTHVSINGYYQIKLTTLDAIGQELWFGWISTKDHADKLLPLALGQQVKLTIEIPPSLPVKE
jgi:hypothetical protein